MSKTTEFLGEDRAWSRIQIELHDVQPLFGGVRVLLPCEAPEELVVTRVARGCRESVYQLSLKPGEREVLCQLFVAQDFLTIRPEERPGIPDEARPRIIMTNAQGVSHACAKWAGVVDERFDVLYQALLALASRAAENKPD